MTQRRSQRSSQSSKRYGDSGSDIEMEDSGDETRCICGRAELQLPKKADKNDVDAGLFIQCDLCHAWQHGYCVGFFKEEDVPDVYYCEKCHPELHVLVVRPSGKASSYIPHLKKIGKYNTKKRSKASDSDPVKEESEEPDDETRNDRPPTNGSSTALIPSPEKENKDSVPTREQRRRTQNSSRQLDYEETLRRVLEESTHDVLLTAKEEPSDEESFEETEGKTDNLDNTNNETQSHSDKSDHAMADSADSSSTPDATNGFKRKTLRSSSRQSAKEETSHDDINTQEQESSSPNSKSSGNEKKRTKSSTNSRSKSASKSRKSPANKANNHSASSLIKSQSKPRIPQARSTVAEMQKRVAAILEFIGRTQVDMADEREEMLKLLSSRKELFSSASKSFQGEQFTKSLDSSASFQSMEILTNKLLQWEETFGRYREV